MNFTEGFGKKWIERILGKVDKDQGVANAGKVLGIGNDGQVVPVEQSGGGSGNGLKWLPFTKDVDPSTIDRIHVKYKSGTKLYMLGCGFPEISYDESANKITGTLNGWQSVFAVDEIDYNVQKNWTGGSTNYYFIATSYGVLTTSTTKADGTTHVYANVASQLFSGIYKSGSNWFFKGGVVDRPFSVWGMAGSNNSSGEVIPVEYKIATSNSTGLGVNNIDTLLANYEVTYLPSVN